MTALAETTNVQAFPPALALNLLADARTVTPLRGQLAAIADLSPALADSTATDYAIAALRLIADGHDEPRRLVRDVLDVVAGAGGRWTR